jgi:hypothetical protein
MIFDWKNFKNRRTGQITFYRTAGSLPVISCKSGFLKKPKPEVFNSETIYKKGRTSYSLITKLQKENQNQRFFDFIKNHENCFSVLLVRF